MRRLVQRKMWWGVNRRAKRNLHRNHENMVICESKKDIEEILRGRLETIEEEPEEEERERGREMRRIVTKAKAEKGKAIVKAKKVKSGKVFYMLCVVGLASKGGFSDLFLH
ncbi:PREDICTED: uncharacterized protein LOC104818768 [Tarenaya hassleriana]|uniref:uncharacterized protein LOC104818768 n=1 Tax=Tarenaya hassleriana TaxID=28532 RepID=UPI00053C71B8|nr:PREDICTED: uncharacterized protein LOC104818768 [Tarenaya hassleriana]